MSMTEITRTYGPGHLLEETAVRKLYSLAELKALDERPAPEQDDEIDSHAYQNALEKLSEFSSEWWDGRDEIDNYIEPELFGKAGIHFKPSEAEFNVGYGGRWFVLPKGTTIDTPTYLKAMKAYFAGLDYRGPEYRNDTNRLAPFARAKIDLRSKDAKIATEDGLVVHYVSRSWYGTSNDNDMFPDDGDYYYEGMSDTFKEQCNLFLKDMCDEAAKILEDDYEYCTSEEYLLDMAEANDYRFNRMGRIV